MADVLVKPAFQTAFPDTGDTTRWGPSAWNAARLFTGGSAGDLVVRDTGSATGATFRQPGWLDVRTYGAVGNGVADDTSAIQAALDAAKTLGGVPLFFPDGVYVVTSTLTWVTTTSDNAVDPGTPAPTLIGAGRYVTVFDNRVASGPMLNIESTTNNVFQRAGALRNFTIRTSTSPAASDGIRIRGVWQTTIDNVQVRGLTGDGIRVFLSVGDPDGSVYLIFEKCWIEANAGIGLDVEASGVAVENSWLIMRECFIQNNALGGVRYRGIQAEFTNTAFEINGSSGSATFGGLQIKMDTGNNRLVRLHGCDFGHNGVNHLDIQSCACVIAENCEFTHQAPSGLPITTGVKVGGSGIGGTVIVSARFINSFVRKDTGPFTMFAIGSDVLDCRIEDTRWDQWSDGTMTRFTSASIAVGSHLKDEGVFTWGHIVKAGAVRGDIVTHNDLGIRGANGAATNTFRLIRLSAADVVELGSTSTRNKITGPSTNVSSGRFNFTKGTNQAAANDLTLLENGNVFHVTGATQINAITTTNWQAGSELMLIFDSTPTVKHNTAGGANTAVLLLAGSVDFVASANDTLTLVYDGTSWFEKCRAVI